MHSSAHGLAMTSAAKALAAISGLVSVSDVSDVFSAAKT